MIAVRSARQVVTEEIRSLINRGDLGWGQRISIDALASRFGVSRTPVREALFQLSVEGLVLIEPRIGVFIREITNRDVLDIYEIKRVLEPLMAAWATGRGAQGPREEFLESVGDLQRAADRGEIEPYVQLLEVRHAQLLDMAQSGPLGESLGILEPRIRMFRFRNLSQPGHLARSAAQHYEIAQAVAGGDSRRAYEAMQRHMEDAKLRVTKILVPNGFATMESEPAGDSQEGEL